MRNAAVIGHPIGHTMSPFIHQRLFALSGESAKYGVMDVPDLSDSLKDLQQLDGFNVTIPHKIGILSFLDGVEEKARVCGSVNTVKVEGGKMYGTTTDGAGCRMALGLDGLSLSGELLILGNGGASRALAFEAAFQEKDFHLTFACREASYEKARRLGDELEAFARKRGDRNSKITVMNYRELEESKARWDLLLNTTSVGMYPKVGVSPVSQNVISRCGAVFDAVYNPGETELLKLARLSGIPCVGGMEMLVYQAAASHQFWYGGTFQNEDIKAICREASAELNRRFGQKGKDLQE